MPDEFGIGADIVTISRFSKINKKNKKNFLNKIFTENELEYCFSKKDPSPHLSARYAAKEAIVKAFSALVDQELDYREIEITNDKRGAPSARINNAYFSNFSIYITLSHCEDKALAFAVVRRNS